MDSNSFLSRVMAPPPSRPRSRDLRVGIASVAVASITLTGCGSSSGSSQSSSALSGAEKIAVSSSAAALVPTEFKDGVTVATSQGYPPTDFVDEKGNITGFDYDLGQALAGKLGIPFEFKLTTFAAIIPGMLAKNYDVVMAAMNDTKAREQKMTFVDYFQTGRALVVPKNKAGSIKSLMDLCGRTVVVTQATANAQVAMDASTACTKAGKPAIKIDQRINGAADLLELTSGKADAQIDDSNTAGYSVVQAASKFTLVPLPEIPTEPAGIGVLNANAGLAEAIQAGLQELIDDGTYKKLLDKYGMGTNAVAKATINGAVS